MTNPISKLITAFKREKEEDILIGHRYYRCPICGMICSEDTDFDEKGYVTKDYQKIRYCKWCGQKLNLRGLRHFAKPTQTEE